MKALLNKVLLLIIIAVISGNIKSQSGWVSQATGTSDNLFSIFFIDANTGWAVSYYDKLVKTTNGGANWQVININLGTNENTIFFINSLTGWTGGFNGKIGKSTDGGLTWSLQYGPSNPVESIEFANPNTGYAVGQNGLVIKTTNGGTSWTGIFNLTGDSFMGLDVINENTLYICGNNSKIYFTTNSGANWIMQNSGGSWLNSIKFANSMTGYSVSQNYYRKTTNGGLNWVSFDGGLGSNDYQSVFFSNPQTGWAAGNSVIKGTNNGGINWFTQEDISGVNINSVFFVNNLTGWVCGNGGLIKKTTTGGASLPAAPTNLSAVPVSSSKITLNWQDNSGSEYYFKIERSLNNINYTLIDSVILNTTSFTDSSLAPNTGHFYRVYASNIAGNSAYSNIVYATTFPGTPGTVTLLYPANNSTDIPLTPFILWNNTSGATGYHLQVSTDSLFNNRIVNDSALSNTIYPVPNGTLNNNTRYFWRVKANNNIGSGPWSTTWNFRTQNLTGVNLLNNEIPKEFKLNNNYPNPFNPTTNIEFQLPKSGFVKLKVFDMLGREIETLVNKNLNAGIYKVDWDAAKYSSGVYFYRIQAGEYSDIKKMILVK